MICHSFEFEPLGRRDPGKKYEPRFRHILWDELTEELPNPARRQAARAYEDFLPMLLQRDPQDVPSILAGDPNRKAELKNEAVSLVGWWKSNEGP